MAKTGMQPRRRTGRTDIHRTGFRANSDSDRKYLRGYYQYSSEAYELAPMPEEYEEEPSLRKRRKIKKLSRKEHIKKIRRRNAPKYVYENQHERKLSFTAIITSVLLFSGVLLYLLTFSLSAVKQHQIDRMYAQLNEIKDDNAALKNGAYDSAELERVKEIAMTKLGMVVPEDHQKVYIDVPKQSYFVQNEPQSAETEESISLGALGDLFGSFIPK